MNYKTFFFQNLTFNLRKVKKVLQKPLINPLRDVIGSFTVYPLKHFNNYNPSELSKSFLPRLFNCYRATPLCYIMYEKGTDKTLFHINGRHNYTTFYYAAFKELRNKPIRLFELGLGSTNPSFKYNMGELGIPGASLTAWKTFFPNAGIFGADIDKNILFEEERIQTFYTDQTKSQVIHEMWKSRELAEPFDIIIDDGLHEFHPNVCFFENSIHKLKNGGVYIIEDVQYRYMSDWKQYLQSFSVKFPELRFCIIEIPNDNNNVDNNLLVVEKINY